MVAHVLLPGKQFVSVRIAPTDAHQSDEAFRVEQGELFDGLLGGCHGVGFCRQYPAPVRAARLAAVGEPVLILF